MRSSIMLSAPIFAIAALAQDSSSSIDAFPQTSRLTETNSLGVVTGMPGAATSIPAQPSVITSQPAVATSVGLPAGIPAVGPGLTTLILAGTVSANSTRTVVVSANNSTTIIIEPTPSKSDGASGVVTNSAGQTVSSLKGTNSQGAFTNSAGQTVSGPATASSTGAAATMRAVAGGLVGAGAFVAAFL
jgi:hypothetical protein